MVKKFLFIWAGCRGRHSCWGIVTGSSLSKGISSIHYRGYPLAWSLNPRNIQSPPRHSIWPYCRPHRITVEIPETPLPLSHLPPSARTLGIRFSFSSYPASDRIGFLTTPSFLFPSVSVTTATPSFTWMTLCLACYGYPFIPLPVPPPGRMACLKTPSDLDIILLKIFRTSHCSQNKAQTLPWTGQIFLLASLSYVLHSLHSMFLFFISLSPSALSALPSPLSPNPRFAMFSYTFAHCINSLHIEYVKPPVESGVFLPGS